MQFVFGNPKRKKGVASKSKRAKIKTRKENSVKRKKKKNPAWWSGAKSGTSKIARTNKFPTPGEVSMLRAKIDKVRSEIDRKKASGKKVSKKSIRVEAKKVARLEKALKRAGEDTKKAVAKAKKFRAEGYTLALRTRAAKVAKRSKKMAKKKKHGKKIKHIKRKKVAKRIKHIKRRKTAKKPKHIKRRKHAKKVKHVKRARHSKRTKRAGSRRRRTGSRRGYRRLTKGRVIRFQVRSKGAKRAVKFSLKRLNPFGGNMNVVKKIESIVGIPMAELGGLAAGGALYGMVNKMFLKLPFVSTQWSRMLAIPYFGSIVVPALPNLLVGAAASYFGRKQKIKMLEDVGHGMIGSAVVGMGVTSSQTVFGKLLGTGVAGVDYTPLHGVDYTPMGRDSADFGGVDYTPMSGADFGLLPSGMGEYEQSNSDFGGLPEGMGEGQMG